MMSFPHFPFFGGGRGVVFCHKEKGQADTHCTALITVKSTENSLCKLEATQSAQAVKADDYTLRWTGSPHFK